MQIINLALIQLYLAATVPTAPRTAKLADYQALQAELKEFITRENAPGILRMSFHDVQNFNKGSLSGGGHGCVFTKQVLSFPTNNGLSPTVQALQKLVSDKFPNVAFPDGDVISLAGKVAIETRLGRCYKVRWAFGRKPCTPGSEKDVTIQPTFTKQAQLDPFLKNYKMTPLEMAILTIGGHGYFSKSASREADTDIANFRFQLVGQPITKFITTMISEPSKWFNLGTWLAFDNGAIGRFPVDMMFYPSTLAKIKGFPASAIDNSTSMLATEKALVQFTKDTNGDAKFHQKFVDVYAKMLEIGSDAASLTPYESGLASCQPNDSSSGIML